MNTILFLKSSNVSLKFFFRSRRSIPVSFVLMCSLFLLQGCGGHDPGDAQTTSIEGMWHVKESGFGQNNYSEYDFRANGKLMFPLVPGGEPQYQGDWVLKGDTLTLSKGELVIDCLVTKTDTGYVLTALGEEHEGWWLTKELKRDPWSR